MNKIYPIILLLATTLTSCFDEDSYIIKPVPINDINIPYSVYEYQTYFSLNDTMIISHNSYADWDIGFESSPTGFHIILNTSKFMYAGNTNLSDFTAVTSNVADTMIYDRSSGNLDSTAIGNWVDFSDPLNPIYPKKVYIINRGVNESGVPFGYKKIVFEKLENNIYYIRFANLDNSDEHYFEIPKNSSVNFVLFSFDNGGNLNTQQPDKDLWDLNITKYSTILFDNNNVATPYLVRGVLINNGLSVAMDTINTFGSININNISSYTFSTKQDAIGYSWKVFNGDDYVVLYHYNYIIKDRNNNYFKLRFTNFKNTDVNDVLYGSNGYPSFEMEKLII